MNAQENRISAINLRRALDGRILVVSNSIQSRIWIKFGINVAI